MKFTPEVIAALETLKSAAENDFERHRINILERDLTNPPTVEVIDDTHQKFDGAIYHKTKDGHYKKDIGIHRAIYTYYFGEILSNYDIHHIDEKTDNNSIDNLQAIPHSDHIRIHCPKGTPLSKVESFVCEKCGKVYSAFKVKNNRYCPDCRKKIEYHSFPRPKKTFAKICINCNKEFKASDKDVRFCSRHCANLFLNKSKREVRICPICGKEFEIPKSRINKTCSKKCGIELNRRNRKKNQG